MSPQHSDGRLADQNFDTDELLFRRVPNSHIEEGELNLLAIPKDFKFKKNPPECTSALRSKYCGHFSDALHVDCAEKDSSDTHRVFFLRVAELAKGIIVEPPEPHPARKWDLYPYHDPYPNCFAHTTICSCEQGAPQQPVEPPPSVRGQFREWIWKNLQPC